jgi:hypothetical protein
MPNIRIDIVRKGSAPSSTARAGAVAIAFGHISWSSRGGPGSTITTWPSAGTTSPGAVPAGSIGVAPSGTIACLRLPSRTASGSKRSRRAKREMISPILSSILSSRTSLRPAKRPTISAVRSSAVGPSPPLVTTRSTPSSRM